MLDWHTANLDSNTLLSSLRLTQKHSHSTLTLTQPNSIWLICWWQPSCILLSWIQPFCTKKNFIHSFWLTLMMQPSWILPSWIQPFCTKKLHSFILIHLDDAAILNSAILDLVILHKTLTQTNSIWLMWWLQPSWILPCWILPSWNQPFCTKL